MNMVNDPCNPACEYVSQPFDFEHIHAEELELIRRKRAGNGADDKNDLALAALAFSGGGIRSAVFNLGFIQGLASHKRLHLFDYLSTVSGGGYIGGWLSALIHRRIGGKTGEKAGEQDVHDEQAMFATPPDSSLLRQDEPRLEAPESTPVRYLRRYANYLTPRLGISGDTLALISIVVRNIVVMQMLLISLFVSVFSWLLWLAGSDLAVLLLTSIMANTTPLLLIVAPVALLIIALCLALKTQQDPTLKCPDETHTPSPAVAKADTEYPNVWVFAVLVATMSAGVWFALALTVAAKAGLPYTNGGWSFVALVFYVFAWRKSIRRDQSWLRGHSIGGALLAGLTLSLSLTFAVENLPGVLVNAPFGHVVAFFPLVSIAFSSAIITIHLAVSGPAIHEESREWWARAGGQGVALSLVWALAYLFLLYVPPLLQYGAEVSITAGGLWAAMTWIGARLAHGKFTGGKESSPLREVLSKLTPWLFLLGLLGLVAWLYAVAIFSGALAVVESGSVWNSIKLTAAQYQQSLGEKAMQAVPFAGDLPLVLIVGVASSLLFAVLVKAIDLNLFSAHSFYANRLTRTFLGASRRERNPSRYTGFDPCDDLKLRELAGQRPIHLVNANLNLSGGKNLAWQTRRGASFVFTPGYCGYSTQTSLGDPIGGYRPTDTYAKGDLTLATVVAVSGAAASPNMGFHTSTAVAALLTAFNLRLARWCPNPAREHWVRRDPKWSVGPLFAELTGETNSDNKWVNISDGGHFENLGLYELVRRRVCLIVVTDVGEDSKYQFDDLAMAVRKCWVDLGVRIDIHPEALNKIRLQPAQGDKPRFSAQSWALGQIRYPDRGDPGYLIYVKSSLTGKEPVDIRQYKDAHPAFPHESTVDQWFDEDQFEAYRHLGQELAEDLCRELLKMDGNAAEVIPKLCKEIADRLEKEKASGDA